ncbi:MAG: 50S ribosomal protein L9 [Candidatus Parcubacteria bacterium]|nr:MAG: 50S ribosomal protein L9 [Candidatus Parcubacteria bacterium]
MPRKKKYKKDKNLPVVLLEDIKGIGNLGEIKKIKRGFAIFLLRNRKVVVINKNNFDKLENMKLIAEKNRQENIKKIEEIKQKIENLIFEAYIKIGENKEVYNSITKNDIKSFLINNNIDIKKYQIELEKPIREVGNFTIPINIGYGLYANLKTIVKEQKI